MNFISYLFNRILSLFRGKELAVQPSSTPQSQVVMTRRPIRDDGNAESDSPTRTVIREGGGKNTPSGGKKSKEKESNNS